MIHSLKFKNGRYILLTLTCIISIFLFAPTPLQKATAIKMWWVTWFAHAQTLAESLSIQITPPQPGAYTEVLANLESTSVDLNTAEILWSENGRIGARGRGVKTLSFSTGALGTVSKVRVVINTAAGQRIENSFTVRPAEVDLISQAFTYTPPFYKGKSLSTSKSKIRISAIPHVILENGKRVSSGDLIYTWQQDRQILGSLSGVGKQSIVIEGPLPFEKTRIAVQVASLNGIYGAQKGITIEPSNPQIVFYEKHPTLGIRYSNALPSEFTLEKEEIAVRAEPYFFSTEDLAEGQINFIWLLNGERIEPVSRTNEIVLRRAETTGVAQLTLQIKNIAKTLQDAIATVLIRF